MLHRRSLLALAAGLPFLPRQAAAQVDVSRATAFIQSTGEEMVAAINTTDQAVAIRRERVAAILRRAVHIEGVGEFILARWWRIATPEQRQEYLQLFEQMLILNLSSRFGEYQGVRFSMGQSQSRSEGGDVLVSTTVERPGSPPFSLDWRVAEVSGEPRIIDVIVEGTSLRLTQRSEYNSVISRNGGNIQALLNAMRGQIQQMASRERR